MFKEMSKELQDELKKLNDNIEDVIKRRSDFLDKNMGNFAEFEIGEKLHNCITKSTAICVKHYRYHQGSPEFDDSLSCECKVEDPIDSNFIDNTSRYGYWNPWVNLEDAEQKNEKYMDKLEDIAAYTKT